MTRSLIVRYASSVLIAGVAAAITTLAATPASAVAPAPPPPTAPFTGCPNLGYQVQSRDGSTSELGYFDLNTSQFVKISDLGSSVNAVGYSRAQGVFWGMRTNPVNDTLVRFDSEGNTDDVGPLEGPLAPTIVTTNTGTVDDTDRLIIHNKEDNTLLVIDVDGSDGQVGQVLARVALSRTSPGMTYLEIGDWDFSLTDGLLYSLEIQGDTRRLLIAIDPATGEVIEKMDLTDKLPDGHNYGSVYVEDVSGTIYVSNNDVDDLANDGMPGARSQTFGIYPQFSQVIAYTPGPPLLINDGADCLVATDFGDAPDSYRTLNPNDGPGHIFTEVSQPGKQLRIGTEIDSDLDGMPTKNVDGDDRNLPVNDEDGVPAGTVLAAAQPGITVPITNTTGGRATLAGWLDLDGSGSFDADERVLVALEPDAVSATLAWPLPVEEAGVTSTYLRLRLYQGVAVDPQPIGANFIDGGEIEDHQVSLVPSIPVTGDRIADLIKAGVLLIVCGGLGFLMGGRKSRPALHRRRRTA